MNHSIPYFCFERMDVWRVAMDMIALVAVAADGVPNKSGELADQMRRASQSVVANLAEGVGKTGKDRLRFHRIALGSAYETAAHLEIAILTRMTR